MGSPQTSAGTEDFSLVNNLLSQGAQLNQPEVNWRTGVYYPPMSTEQMWDFSNDSVDLNYLIFNTEIARRTSMMSQPLSKALSGNGLVAMPLWKQGTINQGGPADISARRFVVNTSNSGGESCPIDDNVDAIAPTVEFARYFTLANGNGRIELQVDGLDGDLTTRVNTRNAVTEDTIVSRFYDDDDAWTESTEDFLFRIAVGPGSTRPVPCAIQLADVDGSLEFGPWIAVENAPADCSGPIPAACDEEEVTTMAAVDETIENPYSAKNMVCAWYDGEGNEFPGKMYFTDETNGGVNPYYPYGLCMAAPINLSARTPYKCEASGDSDGACPSAGDMTCVDDATFGQLCSSATNPEDNQLLDKQLSWYECPGWLGTNNSGDQPTIPGACGGTEPDNVVLRSNMDDQSWYNPMEVSKAHRGFIDGDYVSMIYAWSPNWKQNTVGNDRYELYTRRSFDGGKTWTTTPANFTASNDVTYTGVGTTTCETWRDGDGALTDSHVCTVYGAGVPEQSRNVSQLKSMKTTILDPRYTAAGGIPPKGVTDPGNIEWGSFTPIDPTDILNPSRYFVVFEDGDNTTVAEGEAEPLNLGYGRGEMFGDHFTVWAETDTTAGTITNCYPNDAHGDTDVDWALGTGFCNEFDTLEGFKNSLSEEASITASADGDFLYGVWGQFNVDDNGEFVDGDTMFRRVWYLNDYISDTEAWTLPGTNQ